MMTARQHLVLALCIAEWDTAHDAMTAASVVPFAAIAAVRAELHDLILLWPDVTVPVTSGEARRVIREARRYCTEHGDELERLLSE